MMDREDMIRELKQQQEKLQDVKCVLRGIMRALVKERKEQDGV